MIHYNTFEIFSIYTLSKRSPSYGQGTMDSLHAASTLAPLSKGPLCLKPAPVWLSPGRHTPLHLRGAGILLQSDASPQAGSGKSAWYENISEVVWIISHEALLHPFSVAERFHLAVSVWIAFINWVLPPKLIFLKFTTNFLFLDSNKLRCKQIIQFQIRKNYVWHR